MNNIAFLLCLLLALRGHLRHRLQSSFATIGRTLFVALACLVLVSCGGENLPARDVEQDLAEIQEGIDRKKEAIKTLIREGEYCEAVIQTSKIAHALQLVKDNMSNHTSIAIIYWENYGEVKGMLEVARNGCKAETDEPKTWACAEGHSCR